ncbi:hypothetical protein LJK88_48565 [Paenibacillus sp. P26]|nr:hypothetical protein LJK88_48565 [Paenibacillus sp. P26]
MRGALFVRALGLAAASAGYPEARTRLTAAFLLEERSAWPAMCVVDLRSHVSPLCKALPCKLLFVWGWRALHQHTVKDQELESRARRYAASLLRA